MIPFFVVFGGHDRQKLPAADAAEIVNLVHQMVAAQAEIMKGGQ